MTVVSKNQSLIGKAGNAEVPLRSSRATEVLTLISAKNAQSFGERRKPSRHDPGCRDIFSSVRSNMGRWKA